MDFIIKLPVNYALGFREKLNREESFHVEFKALINKFSQDEVSYNSSSVFNIEYNTNHLRLKTLAPQYPKQMQDELITLLTKIFITNGVLSTMAK